MSLVHEALQKAEREKQRKTGDSPIFAQRAQLVVPRPPLPREDKPVAPARAPGFQQTPASPAPACEPSRSRGTAHVAAPAPKSHQTVLVVVAACVALVAIVAIVFIVNRTGSVAHKSEPSGGSSSITVASTPAPPEAGKPRAQTEAFTQPATVTPPAGSQPPADTSQYKITGIMKDPQGKYCAVINGRVVYVEHYIDGAVVKAIERDRVTLDIGGREAVIRLF